MMNLVKRSNWSFTYLKPSQYEQYSLMFDEEISIHGTLGQIYHLNSRVSIGSNQYCKGHGETTIDSS